MHQIQEISNGFFDILDINLVDSVFVFKDEKVMQEFDNYILVKYKAENLKASPTKEILKHFEIIWLPTYITLAPKN